MFTSKTFISVLVLCFCCIENTESYGKVCNDCINFQSCPAAAELAINHRDEVTKNKFIKSFCGYEYLQSQKMAKVCCSDFNAPSGYLKPITPVVKDAIEMHPNLNLLPDSCGDIDGKKITGGGVAKLYEFPWMALISYQTKVCNDCINFQSCPAAAELAINHRDEVTKNKFIKSFCGYEYLQSQKMAKVCCSDFNAPSGYLKPITPVVKDAIEMHPNLNLLPDSCGDIDGKKITGGGVAKLYEFPWMALISYQTRSGLLFKCAGAIINSKYILTAAHCVSDNHKIAGVRIGEFDIRYKTDCQGEEPQLVCETHLQDIRVEDIISHPNFTRNAAPENDVALIRLTVPINFNYKNAFPICLPVSQKLRNAPLAGTIATVAGWGLTEDNIYSPVLLKANITIKTDDECSNLIYNNNPASGTERVLREICAGENRKDSCEGDSGGPLIVQGIYGGADRYIQYGVVSRGSNNCGSEPGVYTDVTQYIEWILGNLKP